MLLTDKPAFTAEVIKTFRMALKDVTHDPALLADWYDEFVHYPLAVLIHALKRLRHDSPHPPKPADLYRYLDGVEADDGRPTADEAWGLVLRVARDEGETGVLTEEMWAGLAGCQAILDAGDEVGARRCFLHVYDQHVRAARAQQRPMCWNVTLGTDPKRRTLALQAAVEARQISADYARPLLPAPNVSFDHVAGLLEYHGDRSAPDQPPPAERWRALVARLQQRSDEEVRAALPEELARLEAMIARQQQPAAPPDLKQAA